MRKVTRSWAATIFALGLISLAVAAPTSAADGVLRPDDRPNHGHGWIASTYDRPVRPDDRARHGPGAIAAGLDRPLPVVSVLRRPSEPDAFDWVDAGVGAAAAFGALLLLAGVSILALRRRLTTA